MVIKDILIVLIAAGVGRIISRRVGQPVILGEILMGMLLGNLGIVNLTGILSDLADIGVLILLFSAGFSISMVRLKKFGKSSSLVAILGVVAPFSLGFFAASYFWIRSSTFSFYRWGIGGHLGEPSNCYIKKLAHA